MDMSGVWNCLLCVQCSCTFNKDRHLTYTYTYCPSMIGLYRINVLFAGREIPKSPFMVNVEGDPSKVTVEGPGVDGTGLLQVGKTTAFHVHTAGQCFQLSVRPSIVAYPGCPSGSS